MILQDYTNHILIKQELTNRLEEVRYHIETKESLLANVSHELKTPLNAIFGLSHILEETDLNAHQKELISKISASSDSLRKVINEILDYSSLKKGDFQQSTSYFHLKDLLDELFEKFYPIAAHKHICLLCDYKFDPDLQLYLDRSRVEQILSNLISNACKFTNEGHVRISVSISEEYRDTVTVKFSIEDTGIGIDDDDLSNVFSEFYQTKIV